MSFAHGTLRKRTSGGHSIIYSPRCNVYCARRKFETSACLDSDDSFDCGLILVRRSRTPLLKLVGFAHALEESQPEGLRGPSRRDCEKNCPVREALRASCQRAPGAARRIPAPSPGTPAPPFFPQWECGLRPHFRRVVQYGLC
jgi:hypothetical protein